MNLRKLGAAGLVSALLIGLLGTAASPASADELTTTVTGKVTLDGKPVKGADVLLTNHDGAWGGSATTANDGTYSINVWDPGTYFLEVNNQTWDDATRSFKRSTFLTTYSGNTVRRVDAKLSQVTQGATTRIDVKVLAGATVKGKVVDEKGRPVAGAYVNASNTTRDGWGWTETDAKGRYEIRGLATGRVQLSASTDNRVASVVKVSAVQGKAVTAKKLVAKKWAQGTLTATVKGLKPNDSVYAYNTKTKFASWIASSPEGGTLKIKEKVAPGSYRIVIGGLNTASKAVTVKKNKTTKAGTLKAPAKRGKVTGTVKGYDGKAVKGANVWVSDSYGTSLQGTTTSSKGKYTVKGIVSGSYTVEASEPSGKNYRNSAKFKATKGKNAKKNVKLLRAYKVSGKVTYKGKPVKGVWIDAEWGGGVETSKSGKFTLKGLRGKNVISARDYYTGSFLYAHSKSLKFSKNHTVNFKLKK